MAMHLATKVFRGIYTKDELIKILDQIDELKKHGWFFVIHERSEDIKGGDVTINYKLVKNWNL